MLMSNIYTMILLISAKKFKYNQTDFKTDLKHLAESCIIIIQKLLQLVKMILMG